MTRDARWRSRRLRYKAVVHVPDFVKIVPAPELSIPIQLCRHISKGVVFCIHKRQLWSENESVEIWYVNGSSVAGTSASSHGFSRHIVEYCQQDHGVSRAGFCPVRTQFQKWEQLTILERKLLNFGQIVLKNIKLRNKFKTFLFLLS